MNLYCFLAALCSRWDLRPGMEPGPPALGAQSLNHWTAREVPEHESDLSCLHLKPKAQPGPQHNEAHAGLVALTTVVLKWPHSLSGGMCPSYRTAFHTSSLTGSLTPRSYHLEPGLTLHVPQDSLRGCLPPPPKLP